jgi:hypothetical protein
MEFVMKYKYYSMGSEVKNTDIIRIGETSIEMVYDGLWVEVAEVQCAIMARVLNGVKGYHEMTQAEVDLYML